MLLGVGDGGVVVDGNTAAVAGLHVDVQGVVAAVDLTDRQTDMIDMVW